MIVHAQLLLRGEGRACETLSFGGFKSSAMEETGLAGVRNLPPSPGRTEAGSRSRLVPSVRDTSRTMSVGELGPPPGSIVVPRGPEAPAAPVASTRSTASDLSMIQLQLPREREL